MNRTAAALLTSVTALCAATAVGTAGSSFVSVSPPEAAPSIVSLPPLTGQSADISESMVALGEPVPPVSNEAVASVTPDRPGPEREPILIRGGISSVGNPSPNVEITPSEQESDQAEAASPVAVTPENPTGSRAVAKRLARKAERDARREAAANPQAAPEPEAAAPPTASPE